MKILVFNAGSSSLKYGVFDVSEQTTHIFKGSFERFRDGACLARTNGPAGSSQEDAAHGDIDAAIAAVPGILAQHGIEGLDAVGHRIAHGGAEFEAPARLDPATLARIETLTPLAPLHNPANLTAIRLAREIWPDLPQFGVFDTAFHMTNPPRATTYAVPKAWRDAGLRRYGFHGTSHKYVARRAAQAVDRPLSELRVISLHLGNGASICAVDRGASIDSSMGMTPLEGLVMGTRSGDLDPGAFGYVQRRFDLDIAQIEAALNSESGLKGLTGASDMRDVAGRAAEGDADARLALDIYAYRARKYIGAYAAAMGGVDALVFTGGVGENDASMRARICDGLDFIGIRLDPHRNAQPQLENRAAPAIHMDGAPVQVIVTETAEQLMIAQETAAAMI